MATAKAERTMGTYRKVPLLNVYVHDVTMDEVLDNFDEGLILTLHTDMLMKLQKDRAFYDIFDRFDLVTCDSQILFFAAKLLGTPLRERVSGSDFFPKFYMRHKDNAEVRIFLCGGLPGVADEAAAKINRKVGREIVVGCDAPAFDYETRPEEVDRVLQKINDSGATVLVVGLGGGRQEKFIVAYKDRLPNVRLFLPLGGTIDYEAETLRRPAPWVTNAGFEWFYRVLKEPKQRWHRYFVQQPPVLWRLIGQRFGLYRDPMKR